MRKLTFLLACLLLIGVGLVNAQSKSVSGKVLSAEDGQPIIGASVMVKGTTTGTITGVDGDFTITLAGSAKTLVISYVGMKTLEVDAKANMVVKMESDTKLIDEVVVTALGISREKKSLGYSVQEVKSEDLMRTNNPDLVSSLSGKIAGIEVRQSSGMPGAPSQVFIRGARSFSGNNQPLYVVDGMPISSGSDYSQTGNAGVVGAAYSNRTVDIDPNDIESINVLKGQAASALYGLRASNGVILITTKSGKNAKGKTLVTFNTSYTTDEISRPWEPQMEYAHGSYGSYTPVGSFTWGPKISELSQNATYGGDANGHPGLFFDPFKGTWVTPQAYNNAANFFQKGTSLNNSINISKAGEFGNFSVGIGNTDQEGIVSIATMKRYTAKASGTINLTKKWNVTFSSNYSDSKISKMPSGNDSWLFTVYGAPSDYDLMGSPYYMPDGPYNKFRQLSYRRGSVGENPRWAMENNHYLEQTKRFFGNIGTEYNPADWLNIKYQIGIDTYTSDMEDLLQMGSTRTGQSLPTAYLKPTNLVYPYNAPTGGRIDKYGLTRRNLNSLLSFTFKKQITDDLSASLMLGNEIDDRYTIDWTMTGTGFTIPGWNNMSNTSTQTADGGEDYYRSVGFYGNLSLDYKNMLYFNATGRNDIVSSMPSGNRSFFYPSASLGFVFTELPVLSNNDILNFGKARVSYAAVGQAGSYNERVYVQGAAGSGFLTDGITFPLGGVVGFRPSSTLYDPTLKPQNTTTWEVGLELKGLNNRVGIDYSYSSQLAKDQIFAVPMAGSTGYSQIYMNAGEMSSKSHEIMAFVTPIQTKDFEWTLNVNFTKTVNTCLALADGVDNISLGGFEDPNIRASVGDTYPAIYGTQFLKDDAGNVLVDDIEFYDDNNNGVQDAGEANPYYGMPLSGEFGKIGDVSPDFIVGVTNQLRYKFITLTAQLDWKQGGQIYSGSNRLVDLYGTSKATADRSTPFIYNGYKSNGEKNDIERGGENDPDAYQDLYVDIVSSISEAYVYESSYLKLREIALNLALPKKITPKWMSSASLNLSARNILLWTALPNFDPETSQGMGNMAGGMDYMSLPQTTSYGVGLNITF